MSKTLPKPFVIVPFGGPGCGKSTLSNFLIDGKDSKRFDSSDTPDGSATTEITHYTNWALNDKSLNKRVQVFDTPGIGATDFPIEFWVKEVERNVPKG